MSWVLAIGCMCAFDMGGPVNKAAYVTGTAMLTEALAAGVGTDTYNFGTNFMLPSPPPASFRR